MFVGDGINDSPVLAQADVGLAINPGSDITINAAGIVLMKDSLGDVVNALQISKASFKRITINFIWAFLYNILLIPIAMGALYPFYGFKLDPMLAGAAMALSSISVVLSSLMLKLYRPFISAERNKSLLDVSFDSEEGPK
jgi:Cu+-exporting ATPase